MTKRMSVASFRTRAVKWSSHWRKRLATHDIEGAQKLVILMLTAVIAGSALYQAWLTKTSADATVTQTRLAEEAESRLTQAVVNIAYLRHKIPVNPPTGAWVQVNETTPSVDVDIRSFTGYRATNASWFDITITDWYLEVGIPEDDNATRISPLVYPIDDFNGEQLTDSFPRRLRRGDSVQVLFREEQFLSLHRRRKSWIRIAFQDAMGKPHRSQWIEWTENSITAHSNPGPGLVAPEQKAAMKTSG